MNEFDKIWNETMGCGACEDCISREAVLEYIDEMPSELTSDGRRMVRRRTLEEYISDTLPSVTPKFTDEEIQKMQELEQAQLDKAYELGMQTSFEEWLASFNTNSATECFTAVQELKKRLEGDTDAEELTKQNQAPCIQGRTE